MVGGAERTLIAQHSSIDNRQLVRQSSVYEYADRLSRTIFSRSINTRRVRVHNWC
jgi:hypothetical protein